MSKKMLKTAGILFIAAQVLVLMGLTASYYLAEDVGEEIRLKTEPIDPRDLFYGDYVYLNYEISTLPEHLWRSTEPIPREGRNEKVFVLLEPCESVYCAEGVYHEKAEGKEGVWVSGLLNYYDQYSKTMRIQYGFEKYFVPENTGTQWERRTEQFIVKISITPWGQSRILEISEEREEK
ncbi:GDYXXLXY domain-containing protein [Bacillus marinisedimentorum]|uniref:GDYXXLXY domain-containing protein n=1 Tax=Bacillus marinisedimentorum TaxID=1821260 RepID=UPI0012FFA7BA|nr:GDYXXLXY domain-containing protein [Bacillus marinisedimentorum]